MFDNEPRYDVRLSSGTKDYDMEIVLFNIDKMSIEDIENKIEEIWTKLNLEYYEEEE